MKIPFLDLKANYNSVKEAVQTELNDVLENTAYIMGPKVAAFEKAFAAAHNVKHCIAVSSGTDSNHLGLWVLGVGHGDEVIIPANTFIATAWGATLCGATPVFVDCHQDSYNLDPTKLEAAITSRTKAIVVVHLYGQPADMDPILEIGKKHNIPVMEDSAQAHLAEYKGKKIGGLGIVSAFSFYPGKNLGAYGEGGALTTNDDALAEKARLIRDHGASGKYYHNILGCNYRMSAIQGAVLGVKLNYLDQWTNQRRAVAEKYNELLGDVEGITIPKQMPYAKSVYHLYVIQVENSAELQTYLGEKGVASGLHYPLPLHLQQCFQASGYKAGDFPNTEKLANNCLSLPIYPELTDEQITYVANMVRSYFKATVLEHNA